MAHPYSSHKNLHTDRLGKMLGGMAREKGPKAKHEQKNATKAEKTERHMHGEKSNKYARGGRTKGKTNININVMPGGADQKPPMPAIMPAGLAAGAPPPMAAPKPPMPGPGMPPGGAPGMPPGMMHKRGGRSYKKGGKVHSDEAQDRVMMAAAVHKHEKHMHKGEKETKLKRGGRADTKQEGMRNGTKVSLGHQTDRKDIGRPPVITKKDGGRLFSEHTKMKDIKHAAGGGKGRLEKIRLYGKEYAASRK